MRDDLVEQAWSAWSGRGSRCARMGSNGVMRRIFSPSRTVRVFVTSPPGGILRFSSTGCPSHLVWRRPPVVLCLMREWWRLRLEPRRMCSRRRGGWLVEAQRRESCARGSRGYWPTVPLGHDRGQGAWWLSWAHCVRCGREVGGSWVCSAPPARPLELLFGVRGRTLLMSQRWRCCRRTAPRCVRTCK